AAALPVGWRGSAAHRTTVETRRAPCVQLAGGEVGVYDTGRVRSHATARERPTHRMSQNPFVIVTATTESLRERARVRVNEAYTNALRVRARAARAPAARGSARAPRARRRVGPRAHRG